MINLEWRSNVWNMRSSCWSFSYGPPRRMMMFCGTNGWVRAHIACASWIDAMQASRSSSSASQQRAQAQAQTRGRGSGTRAHRHTACHWCYTCSTSAFACKSSVLPSMIWIGSLMNDSASLRWPSQATLFCAEDRCHRSLPFHALIGRSHRCGPRKKEDTLSIAHGSSRIKIGGM